MTDLDVTTPVRPPPTHGNKKPVKRLQIRRRAIGRIPSLYFEGEFPLAPGVKVFSASMRHRVRNLYFINSPPGERMMKMSFSFIRGYLPFRVDVTLCYDQQLATDRHTYLELFPSDDPRSSMHPCCHFTTGRQTKLLTNIMIELIYPTHRVTSFVYVKY